MDYVYQHLLPITASTARSERPPLSPGAPVCSLAIGAPVISVGLENSAGFLQRSPATGLDLKKNALVMFLMLPTPSRSWENNKRGVRTRVWRGCSQNMEGERDESGFLRFSVEWVGIRNSKISFPSAQCSEYLGYPGFNSWFFVTLRMLLCLLWKWRYHLWVFLMRRSSACKRDNVCLIHVWKVWAPQKHSFHHILVSYLENGNRRRKYF